MSRGNLKDVDLFRIAAMDIHDFIAIGFAATGPSAKDDELLSLAIVDAKGSVLFDQRVRPTKRKHWLSTKEARGITWEDVKDERELAVFAEELERIIGSAPLVVAYNVPLVVGLLKADGVSVSPRDTFDLRSEYAAAFGRWSDSEGDYSFASLSDCATRYGYQLESRGAVQDAKAIASVYRSFVGECRDEAGVERTDDREGRQRGDSMSQEDSKRHDDRKSRSGSGAHAAGRDDAKAKSSKGKTFGIFLVFVILAVLVILYTTRFIGG